MKFSCEKAALMEAVSIASRGVSPKSSIPAIEGVLLNASDNLKITGYNLEMGIETITEAQVSGKGKIVLNARLFGEIIRKLPDDTVSISTDDKLITTIKCSMSEFTIPGISADDFPQLPEVLWENNYEIKGETLKSMIRQTIFAVSDNENKPIHTGVLFDIENDEIKLVAVDGYRLALRKESISTKEQGNSSFVVPGKTLNEIEKIISEDDETVSISVTKKHILFKTQSAVLMSRLLEGEFLKYQNAIPAECKIKITAGVRSFINSIERVSLIVNERIKNPIHCFFDYGVLKLSCMTTIGKSYDEVSFKGDGEGLEIGFNNRYLLDALKACEKEEVVMEFISPLSPCVIKPVEGDEFLFLVLPVRLKSGE